MNLVVPRNGAVAIAIAACLATSIAACSSSSKPSAPATSQHKGSITFGLDAPPFSFDDLPALLAIKTMQSEGYTIKIVKFQSPQTMTEALQNGQIDIGDTSAGTIFSAVDAGLQAKAFLATANSDYEMVAKAGLDTCASLSGKRVAVESTQGTTGSLTKLWFTQDCPSAKPNVIVVPGSTQRVAGMIANQIDASPIDVQSGLELQQKEPGKFQVIPSFSTQQELAAMDFAQTSWMTNNAATLKAYTAAYVADLKGVYANPSIMVNEAVQEIPGISTQIEQETVAYWISHHLWDPVAGVQPAYIQQAIAFYGSANPYKTVTSAAQVSTTDYVSGLSLS